jgi:hypothetical protein
MSVPAPSEDPKSNASTYRPMTRTMHSDNLPLKWAEQALSFARTITNSTPGRGPATDGEARAARYVKTQLSRSGIADVRSQSFTGLRSIWLFLALAFGLALLGHAAFWLLRSPFGPFPALAISAVNFAFSGFLLWRRFSFRGHPLRQYLPHGPSQNVIAVLPPEEKAKDRVVFIGHLDSQRAVFWFASDLLVKVFAFLAPVGVYGVILSPLAYGLVVVSGQDVWIWIGVILAVPHFFAWFTGMTADLGPYSPGANGNAAGVGTLLALGERLRQEPLQFTEVWLVFSGCEETGCDGMKTFLDEYGERLQKSLFIDLQSVGKGDRLVYVTKRGGLGWREMKVDVETQIEGAGRDLEIHSQDRIFAGMFTDIGPVWFRGLNGVCIQALPKDSGVPPELHRLTDTPDRLEVESLGRTHTLVWNLLKNLDRSHSIMPPIGGSDG